MKCHARHAKRNNATLKPPKMTPSAELIIGTAIRPSRKRLRTVANGCGRLRTVGQRRANTPNPIQSETGTLATHSGKVACHKPPISGHVNHSLAVCKVYNYGITDYRAWYGTCPKCSQPTGELSSPMFFSGDMKTRNSMVQATPPNKKKESCVTFNSSGKWLLNTSQSLVGYHLVI